MAAPRSIEGAFYKSPWWVKELLSTCFFVFIACWFFLTEIFHTDLSWESIFIVCQTYGVIWFFGCAIVLNWTTFLHELGHAVAATLVGYPVHFIQIGVDTSRKPIELRLLGYKWVIYSLIGGGGLVSHGVKSAHHARFKMACIVASGPLVSIAVFVLLIFTFFRFSHLGGPEITEVDPTVPFYLLIGLIIYTGGHLCRGLIPRQIKLGNYETPNDGLLLLQLRSLSDQTIQSWVEMEKQRAEFHALHLSPPTNLMEAQRLADQHPDNATVLYLASTIVRQTGDSQYLSYLQRASGAKSSSTSQRITVLDEYLTGLLEHNLVETEPKADDLSQELVAIHDDKITAQGTRGGILIDRHQLQEGEFLLKEVIEKSTNPLDKAYSCVFLALAEKERGDLKKAREYAQKARLHHSICAALKRITDL